MVSALVALSKATDTQVVAEGIETMSELVSLAELGVAFGQGYFLGRPSLLPTGVKATEDPRRSGQAIRELV
jgi:EAL domain-containing protein (putative c-di-GMP-specific phosphodiesterase class I)